MRHIGEPSWVKLFPPVERLSRIIVAFKSFKVAKLTHKCFFFAQKYPYFANHINYPGCSNTPRFPTAFFVLTVGNLRTFARNFFNIDFFLKL